MRFAPHVRTLTPEAGRSSLSRVCVDRFLYVVEVKALLAVPPEGTADRPPAAVIYSLRTSSVARPLDSARHLSYDRLFS